GLFEEALEACVKKTIEKQVEPEPQPEAEHVESEQQAVPQPEAEHVESEQQVEEREVEKAEPEPVHFNMQQIIMDFIQKDYVKRIAAVLSWARKSGTHYDVDIVKLHERAQRIREDKEQITAVDNANQPLKVTYTQAKAWAN
ncbi:hypothetical protein GGF32_008119, partial [Allomyces javanicus]